MRVSGRPVIAAPTQNAPVSAEEAPGEPLHRRLQRGCAPARGAQRGARGQTARGETGRQRVGSTCRGAPQPRSPCALAAPADDTIVNRHSNEKVVSMHLQVRGAP